MSNFSVQLHQVSFTYPKTPDNPIIDKVSFDVLSGQWVSIIGANGSGKSTLVKLLNGLLPAQEGHIVIHGMPLSNETLYDIRQRIGFIFQNPDNQFIGSTVMEDIVFGLENMQLSRDEMDRRIQYYAHKMNISDLLLRHPNELSGGQKQRAAIAAILAMEPQIIIFDEATSMLDEEARNEMIEIMHNMRKQGDYTIISITHDPNEIEASDRVIALHEGKIIGDGTPLEIFHHEQVIKFCNLKLPFHMQLATQFQLSYGMPVQAQSDESRLLEELCQLYSTK